MATPWSMVLAKASTGANIGEVTNASERACKLTFGAPSTANFKIRADHELLAPLFNEDTILKVYQGTTLRFNGPVLIADLEGEEGSYPTIAVSAIDPSWYLSMRLVGQGSTTVTLQEYLEGKRAGFFGITRTGDKGQTAKEVIEEANTGANRSVHFKIGAAFLSGSTGAYTAGPFKSALACINDLANGVDGFDWKLTPLDEGTTWGEWNAVPVLGETKNTVLEYGPESLNNMRQISYVRDRSNEAQRAVHLPESLIDESLHFTAKPPFAGSELPLIIAAENAAAAAEHGLNEQLAEASGIIAQSLREDWVNDFIAIRAHPRQVISFTLDIDDGTGRVPVYGTDFNLGDFVTARGIFGGTTLFNGSVRVYGVEANFDQSGIAKIKPILVDDNNEL